MLKFFNILCLVFICNILFAQTKKTENLSIEEQDSLIQQNSHCLHTDKYNPAQRKQFYPFNLTEFISIISFRDTVSEFSSRLPVNKGVLDSGLVEEEVKLSITDIEKLTDLFYNYGYLSKKYGVLIERGACYDPHNAILFFNTKRKVIAYIEICFDCHDMRLSSKKISTGENCMEKFSLLKNFFTSRGIKFVSIQHTEEK